jgi:hypothetical protein
MKSYVFRSGECQTTIKAILAVDHVENLKVARVELALEVVLVHNTVVFVGRVTKQLFLGRWRTKWKYYNKIGQLGRKNNCLHVTGLVLSISLYGLH